VQDSHFDAFGEPLEYAEPQISTAQRPASRWMTRIGMGLFWSLLALIVVARAAYFNPDFASSFAQAAIAIKTMFGA